MKESHEKEPSAASAVAQSYLERAAGEPLCHSSPHARGWEAFWAQVGCLPPLPTFTRSLLDPRPPRGLRVPRVSPVVRCAACGADAVEHAEPRRPGMGAAAYYSIHRDGFGVGPEVALCDACGWHETLTIETLWRRSATRWAAMNVERCVFCGDHDPETLTPRGQSCGAVAVEVIHWLDGRTSTACHKHGLSALDDYGRSLVQRVTPIGAAS